MTSTLFDSSARASIFLRRSLAGAALLAALAAPSAKAILMTSAYETKLESWLGQGDLSFTSIYNASGADSSNAGFHAAVDGKGPTITLMHIAVQSLLQPGGWVPAAVIGGYNPQSWHSAGGVNITIQDAERSAFLFNLTSGLKFDQKPSTWAAPHNTNGQYQTFNDAAFGPSFGLSDLRTNLDAESLAMEQHFAALSYQGHILAGIPQIYPFSGLELEIDVYTFAPAVQTGGGGHAVPDAVGSLGLLGMALLGLAGLRRLKADGLARA